MSQIDDIARITQLMLRERQGRDRGGWPQMRQGFAADSTVRLSKNATDQILRRELRETARRAVAARVVTGVILAA
jgi:hypothetical protein